MFNELLQSIFNFQKNHIPSFQMHIKYKKSRKKKFSRAKKRKKKQRKKSRNENENECSMNYLAHLLMSTRTIFHLPTCTWSTRNQEIKKKNVLEPKEEKKKKPRKKSRKENENECSMNCLDYFLMSTKTTFHLPTCTWSNRNQEKKKCFKAKRKKNKETKKEINKG